MKVTLAFGDEAVESVADLLKHYAADEFASRYRSTIPHLLFWRNPADRLAALLDHLGETVPESVQMTFEYKVAPIRGSGKPSHTDLLIRWEKTVIGIEAKWTEPEYETVSKWLGPKPTENRTQVLAGWCELLSRCSTRAVRAEQVGHLAYQMVHRAASLCTQEVSARYLLYEVFQPSDDKRKYYMMQLQELRKLTISEKLRIGLLEIPITKSRTFDALPTTSKDLSALIVEELRGDETLGGRFLLFDQPTLTMIK